MTKIKNKQTLKTNKTFENMPDECLMTKILH